MEHCSETEDITPSATLSLEDVWEVLERLGHCLNSSFFYCTLWLLKYFWLTHFSTYLYWRRALYKCCQHECSSHKPDLKRLQGIVHSETNHLLTLLSFLNFLPASNTKAEYSVRYFQYNENEYGKLQKSTIKLSLKGCISLRKPHVWFVWGMDSILSCYSPKILS